MTGSTGSVLEVRGAAKAYRGTHALRGVSFEVERGAIHALLGGNGSGKSTMIKILAGVVMADAGEIRVGGVTREAATQTPAHAKAMGLHFVHQQNSTFGDLTVAENLALGHGFETGRGGRVRWREQRRRSKEVLERFHIDADPATEVRRLSGATQTMVAIARALQDQETAHDGVLVLDEPTASLPRYEVDLLMEALRRYAAAGQTILYVSHRLPEVLSIARRATVLRDGEVAATLEGAEFNHDTLVSLIAGHAPTEQPAPADSSRGGPTTGEVVLEAEGVRSGGGRFTVRAGEVVGVAGLLGSGRSSLLRSLFGLSPGEQSHFKLRGKQVRIDSPQAAMRAGIAYVPENRVAEASFADLSVDENLSMAVLDGRRRLFPISRRAERASARALIESFVVQAPSGQAPFSSLSGGNQQKVILARWLRRKPKLLLLDEPTQGVDVGARAEIHGLMRASAAEGSAVVVVSSEFEELAAVCDRAVVLAGGQIVHDIDPSRLSDEALHAGVYAEEANS